jgi:RNA polymerase sigma factor (sigma-70 family)
MEAKMQKSDLNRLFQDARAGSYRALNQLISSLRPLMYRRASRFVADWQPGIGPSTLTQEVSHSLARMITKVRGSGNGTLITLVNKLVLTTGITAFRRDHSHKRDGGKHLSLEDVTAQVVDERQGPDEQLMHKQRAHRLLVEIAQLPERQRIALEGALAGEAPAELAAKLACSEIAVTNLLQRAKQKLQQADETQVPTPLTSVLLVYLQQASAEGVTDPALFALDYPEHHAALREFLLWLEAVRRLWSEAPQPEKV